MLFISPYWKSAVTVHNMIDNSCFVSAVQHTVNGPHPTTTTFSGCFAVCSFWGIIPFPPFYLDKSIVVQALNV
ncbi:hypothetical protein H2248_006691 [Termitomyces sp. 'cryptogamus']|nr:hypothetical protein H2248_006691 [Termitomyces sp. 'cryptogamus']